LSMIKINLLPPNIHEGRAIKRMIALFVILLVLIIGANMWFISSVNKEKAEWAAQAEEAERLQAEAKSWQDKEAALRGEAAIMDAKVKFFDDVKQHNDKYPTLFETVAKWTYRKITYSSLTTNGQAVQMEAFAPSLSDAGKYLLNLYRATNLFSSVAISGVPGYPNTGEGQASSSSFGSMGGGANTFGSAPPLVTGPSSGPAGFGSAPPLVTGPSSTGFNSGTPAMPGIPGMIGPGGPRGTSYGGMEAITTGVDRATLEKTLKGFKFNVMLNLLPDKYIIAPTPGGDASAVPGGMPGGAPGMPGMAPGGMP